MERITGLRVESGLVQESLFRPGARAHARGTFPAVELIEAATEPALAMALAKAVERTRPVEARLARVHDCLWLRMWLRPQSGPLPEPGTIRDRDRLGRRALSGCRSRLRSEREDLRPHGIGCRGSADRQSRGGAWA